MLFTGPSVAMSPVKRGCREPYEAVLVVFRSPGGHARFVTFYKVLRMFCPVAQPLTVPWTGNATEHALPAYSRYT